MNNKFLFVKNNNDINLLNNILLLDNIHYHFHENRFTIIIVIYILSKKIFIYVITYIVEIRSLIN